MIANPKPFLSLSKESHGIEARIEGCTAFHLRGEKSFFTLSFEVDGSRVDVELNAVTLRTLGLQCIAFFQTLAPHLKIDGIETMYRKQAEWIKELDPRSIQILLKELQFDTLLYALWYMKDSELMRKIIHGMPFYYAEILIEDLAHWMGSNPDFASIEDRRRGRSAVQEVTDTASRLMAEGQIEEYFGEMQ